jgi:uncharacterized protein
LGSIFSSASMRAWKPYRLVHAGETLVAGIFTLSDPMFDGAPDGWMTYFAVADADAAAEAVRRAGGTVHREAFDVPGVGRIVIASDPGGAAMGLMTPAATGDATA